MYLRWILFCFVFYSVSPALDCTLKPVPTTIVGTEILLQIQCDNNIGQTYSWNFGDGDSLINSSNFFTVHTYIAEGSYTLLGQVAEPGGKINFVNGIVDIINPVTLSKPSHTSSIIFDTLRNRVWSVNPDNNSVVAVTIPGFQRSNEIIVGKYPRTLAMDSQGNIWVCNQKSADISIIDGQSGKVTFTLPLIKNSRPYGIVVDNNKNSVYVSLQATHQLVKIDITSKTITSVLNGITSPRGIAVSHDGNRIFVTRFIHDGLNGEVIEINGSTFTPGPTLILPYENTEDTQLGGSGAPNLLNFAAITPDGKGLWIGGRKDNILRGTALNGEPLDHENTIRSIAGLIDLQTNTEKMEFRFDLNDRSLPWDIAFTSDGLYGFISCDGSNSVDIYNVPGKSMLTFIQTDSSNTSKLAPQGLVLSPDDSLLFVQYYTTREIVAYSLSELNKSNVFKVVSVIKSVDTDSLSPLVLKGKQVFHNSGDTRMAEDGYISCNACHVEGGHDGRSWDRTSRGEGLRNTTTLLGKAGLGHGPLFWTANSDEIQDSEGGIRSVNRGSGFMSDVIWNNGTIQDKLGDPKAGHSPELDALAAFINSLTHTYPSPYRNPDGTMTAEALAGKVVFERVDVGCIECHSGQNTTLSNFTDNRLFDVGTFSPTSGFSSGGPLTGLDVPTVNGVWYTAPYLHDGSANTLMEVLTTKNTGDKHGATSHLTQAELNQLVAYMLQLDDSEKIVTPVVKKGSATDTNGFRIIKNRNGIYEILIQSKNKPELQLFSLNGKKIYLERGHKFIQVKSQYWQAGIELDKTRIRNNMLIARVKVGKNHLSRLLIREEK